MRQVVRLFSLFVLLLSCANGWSADRPNVIFVLADDMGYGDLSCQNPDSKIRTPSLDRLASGGIRFGDAHSTGSVCVPARYGLLTGRYPFRAQLRWRNNGVIGNAPTIASMLGKNGYHTSMVGKWHLGFDGGPDYDWTQPLKGGPLDCGFDDFFGMPASLDIPPYYYIRDRRPVEPPSQSIEASETEGWSPIQGAFWREGKIAPGFQHAEVLPRFGEEAANVVRRLAAGAKETPFFLYVALPAPHTPWLPLEEFRGSSEADMYGDFVIQVDATVGRILDALDDSGQAENTLVFFSSDNGPVWYPSDVERFGHHSTGPFRGMKGDAWEGGHRIPFLARWPGHTPPNSVCNDLVSFVDVFATLQELADDRQAAGGPDSNSFLPVLLGEKNQKPRQFLALKSNASAIRSQQWKLITHLGSGGFSAPRKEKATPEGPQGQLYDLEKDPGETTNLWSENPKQVRKLQAKLEELKK